MDDLETWKAIMLGFLASIAFMFKSQANKMSTLQDA